MPEEQRIMTQVSTVAPYFFFWETQWCWVVGGSDVGGVEGEEEGEGREGPEGKSREGGVGEEEIGYTWVYKNKSTNVLFSE